ncbi:MAG: hypothetical protein ACK5MQ_15810 [Pikeienuella sp.]
MNVVMKLAGRVVAFLALVACTEMQGQGDAPDLSGAVKPSSPDYLQIVSVAPDLVEVDSAGTVVRAAPPEGLCIPVDSIQTGPDAVFLIMSACSGATAKEPGGVLSVSISRMGMEGGLPALKRFFETPEGLAGLGYGGGAATVSMVETVTGPRALYTAVEDKSAAGPAFADELISRAFTEIRGRMTVITLISRRGEAQEADAMRAELTRVVAALHDGNA